MMTLEELEEMFAEIRENTDWDLDGDMQWGYFFTCRDPKKLEPVAANLGRAGYRVVRIFPSADEKGQADGDTHFLHVERVETHTPATLHALNQEFYKIAGGFGLDSYDGMDVGPVSEV